MNYMLEFINSFDYNQVGSIDSESAKLTLFKLSPEYLEILFSELVDYRMTLNAELDTMALDMPISLVDDYFGAYLYDVEPTCEYSEKMSIVSKINEIVSVIDLCVTL